MTKESMRILNDIVNVKNAYVVFNYETDTYHLFHYDTEIATIKKNGEIIKVLKCSVSSSRAIYQLTDYLGIDRKIVKRSMVKYTNFVKYSFGNNIKVANELKEELI